jgi:hypothetical protein
MTDAAHVTGAGSRAHSLTCPCAIPPYWREIWLERTEG